MVRYGYDDVRLVDGDGKLHLLYDKVTLMVRYVDSTDTVMIRYG